MSFHGLIAHLFLELSNIPWSENASLLIHLPTEKYFCCLQIWKIINKVAINNDVQAFCVDISFQILWVNTKKYDGWVIWKEYVYKTNKQNTELPSKVAMLFHILTNHKWEFLLL